MRHQRFELRGIKSHLAWAYAALVFFSVSGCEEPEFVVTIEDRHCGDSQAMCTDSSGVDFCATIATDNANCGACGNVCPAGQVCALGQCGVVCAPNLVQCDDRCIDPLTDCAFCGAVDDCVGEHRGIACASSQVCRAGRCESNCPEGTLYDDGICIPLPGTCAQIRQFDPGAIDGEYTLFHEANPARAWTAYCHDMAGTPTEYLTLPAFGSDKNFSLVARFDYPDSDVFTQFMRVRIDPLRLILKVDDYTFSDSSGIITGWNNMTHVPYGHAIACGWGDGAANVDLTGTPFVLAETFCVGAGWGTILPSPDGKSVNITSVNGWCGGVAPCTEDDHGWRIHVALPP